MDGAGPHDGRCFSGMPYDHTESDPFYVHHDDFDPEQIFSTPGCYRDCSPNCSKCCRLCGIDENGNNVRMPLNRLPSDPQCWQHELLCLPVHGMQYPSGMRQETLSHQIWLPPPPVVEVAIPDPDFVDDNDNDDGNGDTPTMFIDIYGAGDDTTDIINTLD